jgi:ATP-dependent exoDNAse (exonuclease V) alpha subunit
MMEEVYKLKKKSNSKLVPLELKGLEFDQNSQDVILIAGTPIIARKNNKKEDICNNETFNIKEVQHKTKKVIIEDGERRLEIDFDNFQELFHPAFCITVHKSQGTTFNHPHTIHEWSKLDSRLKYVALTRSTKLEDLNVM